MAQPDNAVRYEPVVRRPRSAETRARLLRSALSLFRERGYHGAGTNEIGAAAGMTGPSIYRHFATKDDLLVAAVLEAAHQLAVGAATALHEPDTRKSLAMLCTSFVEVSLDDPELAVVFFYESRHLSEEARGAMDAEANRYLAHYQRLVAELLPDVSDEEILIRILAAWHLVAGMCTDLPDVPMASLVAVLTERMLVTLLSDI